MERVQTPAGSRKRILIVDDHPLTRSGLQQLINRQPDLEVCAEAGNRNEARAIIEKGAVDLVITDLSIEGGGMEVIKDCGDVSPRIPSLVLSMHDEMIFAPRALSAGARGYVMKEAGAEVVLAAVRKVLGGGIYLSRRMEGRLLESFAARKSGSPLSPLEALSHREFQVFQMIGEGKSSKEIAARLNLSPKTVDVHRGNIREKLHMRDSTTLFRYAVCWLESQAQAGELKGQPESRETGF